MIVSAQPADIFQQSIYCETQSNIAWSTSAYLLRCSTFYSNRTL